MLATFNPYVVGNPYAGTPPAPPATTTINGKPISIADALAQQPVPDQAPATPISIGPAQREHSDALAQALLAGAGRGQNTPFEALGNLAQLWSGNRAEDKYLQAQKDKEDAAKAQTLQTYQDLAAKILPPDSPDASIVQALIASGNPDLAKQGITLALPQKRDPQNIMSLNPGDVAFDPNTGQPLYTAPPNPNEKRTPYTDAAKIAADHDAGLITDQQAADSLARLGAGERPATPEEKKALGLTPDAPLVIDTATGNYKMLTANSTVINNNLGGQTNDGIPPVMVDERGMPDPDQQAAYLKTLDPQTASLVKQIASYQMDLPRVTSMRGGQRERVAAALAQYDPTFDMTQYGARAAMRKSITSGTYSQVLNSANLVIQHLDALKNAAKDLNNSQFTPYNYLVNKGKETTGDPAITRFNTVADAAASELAKVFKGTGVSDVQSIQEWRHNLSANASPAQITAAIDTAIGDLLKSRIDTVQNQFQAAMGHPLNFTYLTPHSRQVLKDLGIDPMELDPSISGEDVPPDASGAVPATTAAPAAAGAAQDVPEGVDPDVWKFMTPEEKALWQR